jgi:hypothetical protein
LPLGLDPGPVWLRDYHLTEALAHQNRERIPEFTVHDKGRTCSAPYGNAAHHPVHQGKHFFDSWQEGHDGLAFVDGLWRAMGSGPLRFCWCIIFPQWNDALWASFRGPKTSPRTL